MQNNSPEKQNHDNQSQFHSVALHEDNCKGCTICVTHCPVEAIRVQKGKAVILEDRCIDCGECIRVCPNRAKYAKDSSPELLSKFNTKIALVSPSFYSQFPENISIEKINLALEFCGFSKIYQVSKSTYPITEATALYMKNHSGPIISSSCPAVIKLIQIRFPDLIDNLLPVIPPVELAAIEAKKDNPEAGIIFISPCPAKITASRSPLGYSKSMIDGSITASSIVVSVLGFLSKISEDFENTTFEEGNLWCSSQGEADCLEKLLKENKATQKKDFSWISASGMSNVIQVLEDAEDGKLDSFDFIELNSCIGGCIGGVLNAKPIPLAESILRKRKKKLQNQNEELQNTNYTLPNKIDELLLWNEKISSRPVRLLSPIFSEAKKLMDEIEKVREELPGLDCGSCGAPNCNALAEDIVRKRAKKEDCVTILKKQYEQILFGKNKNE